MRRVALNEAVQLSQQMPSFVVFRFFAFLFGERLAWCARTEKYRAAATVRNQVLKIRGLEVLNFSPEEFDLREIQLVGACCILISVEGRDNIHAGSLEASASSSAATEKVKNLNFTIHGMIGPLNFLITP